MHSYFHFSKLILISENNKEACNHSSVLFYKKIIAKPKHILGIGDSACTGSFKGSENLRNISISFDDTVGSLCRSLCMSVNK